MKKYNTIFLLCFLLFSVAGSAQNLLCGKVVNRKGEVLYPASIRLNNSKTATLTDNEGLFCLKLPEKGVLNISFMGYESLIYKFDINTVAKDSLVWIVLQETSIELAETEIRAHGIEMVSAEKRIWIKDYVFWNDKIMTLNLDENMPELSLLKLNDSVVWKYELKGNIAKSKRMYMDFRSNIYLLTDDSAFQISNRDESICFFPGVAMADFDRLILSSLEKCGDRLIYRQYGPHNKSVCYYLVNRDSKDLLYSQRDAESEEFSRDVYAEAFGNEDLMSAKYEGNREIKAKQNTDNHHRKLSIRSEIGNIYQMDFYLKILSRPIEIHLYKIKEQIYIFDHFASKILKYACDGSQIQEINTFYPSRKDIVAKQLILSDNKEEVYALFLRDGLYSLQQIDLNNGKLKGDEIGIYRPFVENISIYKGYIYFICKDNKEGTRKRLFRIKI